MRTLTSMLATVASFADGFTSMTVCDELTSKTFSGPGNGNRAKIFNICPQFPFPQFSLMNTHASHFSSVLATHT